MITERSGRPSNLSPDWTRAAGVRLKLMGRPGSSRMSERVVEYRDVLCVSCSPPHFHQVPVEWKIEEPYHCTICIKRVARRLVMEATMPEAHRMQHGTILSMGRSGSQ